MPRLARTVVLLFDRCICFLSCEPQCLVYFNFLCVLVPTIPVFISASPKETAINLFCWFCLFLLLIVISLICIYTYIHVYLTYICIHNNIATFWLFWLRYLSVDFLLQVIQLINYGYFSCISFYLSELIDFIFHLLSLLWTYQQLHPNYSAVCLNLP
jgi:hypothetical protein